MEKYITDPRTGWKYELVGDYYLPVSTRFETADPDAPEDHERANTPTAVSPEMSQIVPSSPTDNLSNQTPDRPAIGRFGRAHGEYLKRTQRHVYSQLVSEGKLGTYLAQIDEQANAMLDLLIRQMAEREGVTEQFKADNQMAWVRRMSSIHNRAREIVNYDLIYN
ncbi:MAG: TnpV protein [Oscillospiraceae bacterium]|nr:TnpV protein [Oscillospiraceae bacterium]